MLSKGFRISAISFFKWLYNRAKCHRNGTKMTTFSKKVTKQTHVGEVQKNLALGSKHPSDRKILVTRPVKTFQLDYRWKSWSRTSICWRLLMGV